DIFLIHLSESLISHNGKQSLPFFINTCSDGPEYLPVSPVFQRIRSDVFRMKSAREAHVLRKYFAAAAQTDRAHRSGVKIPFPGAMAIHTEGYMIREVFSPLDALGRSF